MTSSATFFELAWFLLSILVTGPTFMSISSLFLKLWVIYFHKRLSEITNTLVWVLLSIWLLGQVKVLLNIWWLGQVRDTKVGMDVSDEMLLNAGKCQGYSFYRFWVIKGKPTGGLVTPLTRLGLRNDDFAFSRISLIPSHFFFV